MLPSRQEAHLCPPGLTMRASVNFRNQDGWAGLDWAGLGRAGLGWAGSHLPANASGNCCHSRCADPFWVPRREFSVCPVIPESSPDLHTWTTAHVCLPVPRYTLRERRKKDQPGLCNKFQTILVSKVRPCLKTNQPTNQK